MCLVIVTKGEGGCVGLRKMYMDSQGVPSDQRAHNSKRFSNMGAFCFFVWVVLKVWKICFSFLAFCVVGLFFAIVWANSVELLGKIS